jgi:uncharacterized membrane protein YkoI
MTASLISNEKMKMPLLSGILATALACTLSFALTPEALGQAKTGAKMKEAAGTGVEPGAKKFEELNLKDFDKSENIDNPWWPLKAGMQWTFEGHVIEEGKKETHKIVFTVTDLVKVIDGVRSRVIYDSDYTSGKMKEQELAYFAQDKSGNVWHLGQYREVMEGKIFVGGQIWVINNPPGAKAGIMMPANPKLGDLSYSEGYAPPPFYWTDRGRVYQVGQKVKVPSGSYSDVLVIEEYDEENPGAFQLKYYAKGVGNIKVGSRGKTGGKDEKLELTKVKMLDEKELAAVREKAMELEKRAGMFPVQPVMERIALTSADHAQGAAAVAVAAPAPASKKGSDAKVISEDEAKAIAEKRVPGKAIDVAIEKKMGANRYVVEVKPAAGGKELDVIIDMASGKVLAVEK